MKEAFLKNTPHHHHHNVPSQQQSQGRRASDALPAIPIADEEKRRASEDTILALKSGKKSRMNTGNSA